MDVTEEVAPSMDVIEAVTGEMTPSDAVIEALTEIPELCQ